MRSYFEQLKSRNHVMAAPSFGQTLGQSAWTRSDSVLRWLFIRVTSLLLLNQQLISKLTRNNACPLWFSYQCNMARLRPNVSGVEWLWRILRTSWKESFFLLHVVRLANSWHRPVCKFNSVRQLTSMCSTTTSNDPKIKKMTADKIRVN